MARFAGDHPDAVRTMFHVKQEARKGSLPGSCGSWDTSPDAVMQPYVDRSAPPATSGRRRWECPEVRPGRMSVLLSILGATAAALAELSLVPYLGIDDAHPHPVLLVAVVWTLASGLDRGLPVAFVGGLALDLLAGRPIGMTALALLAVVGLTAVLGRWLYRVRPVAPVLAVPVLSLVYALLLLGIHAAVRSPVAVPDPIGLVLPGVAYDGLLGLVFGPLAISLHDRRLAESRVDW